MAVQTVVLKTLSRSKRGEDAIMPANLVSLVMQFLTPDMIGRIAAALGLDRNVVQTAINAAVPALLAGFSSAAAKSGGAQSLVDAVKQHSGVLDNFANVIAPGARSSLVNKGSELLASLLGVQDQSALEGAVAKFSGLGQDASGSLLGILAPAIVGTIGKQIGARNPDAISLTNLLSAQKEQIAQALPSGFNNLLGGTHILDALGGVSGTATAAAGQATRAAVGATNHAVHYAGSTARAAGAAGVRATEAARPARPTWLYWLVPLAILAAILAYYLLNPATQVAQQSVTPTQSAVGDVEVSKQLDDSLAALRTSLESVTDEASAKAALPKLQDVKLQIDKVTNLLAQLSPEQRKIVVGVVGPAMPGLNKLFAQLLSIPGVGEVLKPTIDVLKSNLEALAA
jgi:hypothetical protein